MGTQWTRHFVNVVSWLLFAKENKFLFSVDLRLPRHRAQFHAKLTYSKCKASAICSRLFFFEYFFLSNGKECLMFECRVPTLHVKVSSVLPKLLAPLSGTCDLRQMNIYKSHERSDVLKFAARFFLRNFVWNRIFFYVFSWIWHCGEVQCDLCRTNSCIGWWTIDAFGFFPTADQQQIDDWWRRNELAQLMSLSN